MKTVIVPVDLSAFSDKIVDAAVDFAKIIDAKLVLLHVVSLDVGFIIGDVGFQYLPELEKTTLEEDAKLLTGLQERVKSKGVECEALVKQGIPVDVILEETKNLGADIIAIGSQGHGTLYKAFVGSVCSDVIKQSEVPLYVIPKGHN